MSEAIMPVVDGVAPSLPFVSFEDGSVAPERILHFAAPRKEMPQWEQFEEYPPQSLVSVAKSLEDGIEQSPVTVGMVQTERQGVFSSVDLTPDRVNISRLVETVVETIAVTSTISSDGDGEIRIQLKLDVLDGSSIKIEVKDGELKVVVNPASRAAEEILLKSQESFQSQLAERVTAWRINVGVAAFDLRNQSRHRLEEES